MSVDGYVESAVSADAQRLQLAGSAEARSRGATIARAALLLAATSVVIGMAVGAAVRPEPVTAILAIAGLSVLILSRPAGVGVPLAVALLYSNITVVAVRYWGLPPFFPLVVPALMAPALAMRLLVHDRGLRLDRGFFLLVAFVGANFLSAVFAHFPASSQEVLFQLVTEGLLVYFLITNLAISRSVLVRVVWSIILAAALAAGLALLQHLTSRQLVDYGGLAIQVPESLSPNALFRAQGPLNEANFFAQILVIAMPLAAGLVVISKSTYAKAIALTALVSIVVGIQLTGSRGGAVAAAAVIVMLPLIPGIGIRKVFVAASVLILVIFLAAPGYLNRLSSIGEVDDAVAGQADADVSIEGRLVENLVAVQMFVDHPLLGVGPGNYPALYGTYASEYLGFHARGFRPPHSLPLQILAETGLVGMASFAGVMASLLGALWKARRMAERPDAVIASACLVALGGYLVAGLFLHPAYLRFLWLLLGVAAAAATIAHRSFRPQGDVDKPGADTVRRVSRCRGW